MKKKLFTVALLFTLSTGLQAQDGPDYSGAGVPPDYMEQVRQLSTREMWQAALVYGVGAFWGLAYGAWIAYKGEIAFIQ